MRQHGVLQRQEHADVAARRVDGANQRHQQQRPEALHGHQRGAGARHQQRGGQQQGAQGPAPGLRSECPETPGSIHEGGELGYARTDGSWEVAIFARNMSDEDNIKGAIDFNNNTAFVNEPRIVGISLKVSN